MEHLLCDIQKWERIVSGGDKVTAAEDSRPASTAASTVQADYLLQLHLENCQDIRTTKHNNLGSVAQRLSGC